MPARLQEMIAADTGQTAKRIARDVNRDYWMSATEAQDYAVIDLIVGQTAATLAADQAEAAVKEATNTDSPADGPDVARTQPSNGHR